MKLWARRVVDWLAIRSVTDSTFRWMFRVAAAIGIVVPVLAVRAVAGSSGAVAAAAFGGLLGYLGLVFAIVALVADTGVLGGTRAVRDLTRSSSSYLLLIVIVLSVAFAGILRPSEALAKVIFILTALTVLLLPSFVSGLAHNASAENVAATAVERLTRLSAEKHSSGRTVQIESILNDLRASAILSWSRGDVGSYKALVDAFLESSPPKSADRVDIDELPQIRFLRVWIQMQGLDRGSLLFLAGRVADAAADSATKSDWPLANMFVGSVTSTIKDSLAVDGHAEYTLRSLTVARELGVELRRPPADQAADCSGAGESILALDDVIDKAVSELTDSVNWSSAIASAALSARLALIESATYLGESVSERRIMSLAALLMRADERGTAPADGAIDRVGATFFASDTPVVSTRDPRILLIGPLCVWAASLSRAENDTAALRILNELVGSIDPASMDGGSARYLVKCLESMIDNGTPGPDVSIRVLGLLADFAASSGKRTDMMSSLRMILDLANDSSATGPDVVSAIRRSFSRLLTEQNPGQKLQDLLDLGLGGHEQFKDRTGYYPALAAVIGGLAAVEISPERACQFRLAQIFTLTYSTDQATHRTRTLVSDLVATAREMPSPDMTTGSVILGSAVRLAEKFEAVGASDLSSSVLLFASLFLERPDNERHADLWLLRARAEVFERWTNLLVREPKLSVGAKFVFAAQSSAAPASLADWITANSFFRGLANLGQWSILRPTTPGLPGPSRIRELIEKSSDHAVNSAGIGALRDSALRSVWLFDRSPARINQLKELEVLLSSAGGTLADQTDDDRQAILVAFRFAAEYERRAADPADAARLGIGAAAAGGKLLQRCCNPCTDDANVEAEHREPPSAAVVRSIADLIDDACRDLADLDPSAIPARAPMLVRAIDRLGDTVRAVLLLRSTEATASWVREAQMSMALRTPILLAALDHVQPRTRPADRGSVDFRMYSVAREVRGILTSAADGNDEFADVPMPVRARISAAMYVSKLASNRAVRLPAQLQWHVRRASSAAPDGHNLQEWERDELIRCFDWIAARVGVLGRSDACLSARANCIEIRRALAVDGGSIEAWVEFMDAIALSSGSAGKWSIDDMFGRGVRDDVHRGFVKDLLLPLDARAVVGRAPLVRPQILASIHALVVSLLQVGGDRTTSSAVRWRLSALREEFADVDLPEAQKNERIAFLDTLLTLWNPHYRHLDGGQGEPLLPEAPGDHTRRSDSTTESTWMVGAR